MKAVFVYRLASTFARLFMLTFSGVSFAQSSGSCSEISNDVSVAVAKDPSKVLMVVEDALVINEGCAADIVRAAIIASKADASLAAQIVQTAVSVAPKMASLINEAAGSVMPGLAVAPQADEVLQPVFASDKNPGKNPILPAEPPVVVEDFFMPASIRGVYLIQPPASGPLTCDPTNRVCDPNPVSPAAAIP